MLASQTCNRLVAGPHFSDDCDAAAQEVLTRTQAAARQAEAESAQRLAELEARLSEAAQAQQLAAETRLSSSASQLGQLQGQLDGLRQERDVLMQTQVLCLRKLVRCRLPCILSDSVARHSSWLQKLTCPAAASWVSCRASWLSDDVNVDHRCLLT